MFGGGRRCGPPCRGLTLAIAAF
jgi:hypothetical protein